MENSQAPNQRWIIMPDAVRHVTVITQGDTKLAPVHQCNVGMYSVYSHTCLWKRTCMTKKATYCDKHVSSRKCIFCSAIFGIHAYITLMNWSQFCVTVGYDCYMMNRIRHNSLSPIHCLRAFHIYCSSLIYFPVATAIITTKYQKHYFYCLYFVTVTTTIILLCY